MIENYSKTVVRFLKNKEEIKEEVKSLIYESLEEEYGEKLSYTDEEISEVLKKLGSPEILAMKYSNLPKVIVSEKNIYNFYYVNAIVLFVIAVMAVFNFIFNIVVDPTSFIHEFSESIAWFINSSLVSFAIIVIVFIFIDNKKSENKTKEVSTEDLKHRLKDKKTEAKLKKKGEYPLADQVVEIFFTIIFLSFVSYFLDVVYIQYNGIRAEVFNMEYVNSILWVIYIIGVAGIMLCVYKIVSSKKTIKKELLIYVFNIIGSIIFILIFINNNLYTQEYISFLNVMEFWSELFLRFNFAIHLPLIIPIIIIVIVQTISMIVNVHRVLVGKYE